MNNCGINYGILHGFIIFAHFNVTQTNKPTSFYNIRKKKKPNLYVNSDVKNFPFIAGASLFVNSIQWYKLQKLAKTCTAVLEEDPGPPKLDDLLLVEPGLVLRGLLESLYKLVYVQVTYIFF